MNLDPTTAPDHRPRAPRSLLDLLGEDIEQARALGRRVDALLTPSTAPRDRSTMAERTQ